MKTVILNIKKIVIIFISFVIFCQCNSDKTPFTLDVESIEEMAKVVARLQTVNENKELTKDDIKQGVREILKEYGIDTENEIIRFAKRVQKYSYQQNFNKSLNAEISKLRKKNKIDN